MKKLLLLLLVPFLFSCTTNYYAVTLVEDSPLFNKPNDGNSVIVVPKGETVYLSNGKKSYRKIKYRSFTGYVYNPVYSGQAEVTTSSYKTSNNSSKSRPKTVHVKGYTRKNGTYVRPHTRSAPRRKH